VEAVAEGRATIKEFSPFFDRVGILMGRLKGLSQSFLVESCTRNTRKDGY